MVERLPGYLDCSLVSTEFPVAKDLYAFGMRKNSPYRSLFNHHFIRMMESGEMDRIKSKYIQVLEIVINEYKIMFLDKTRLW